MKFYILILYVHTHSGIGAAELGPTITTVGGIVVGVVVTESIAVLILVVMNTLMLCEKRKNNANTSNKPGKLTNYHTPISRPEATGIHTSTCTCVYI